MAIHRMIMTVIGGGSVNWMPGLMKDIYLMDEIEGGEIRLVDPNHEHVSAVASMLHRFNELKRKDYRITVFENRTEALKDTNFVLTTFSPGAMDAFWNDLELPIKYGIRLPVSMTVGPSGISASLRTAPEAFDLVKEMEIYCPGAWLLNVTNPMSVVTRAMNMAAKQTRVIGLCHEFHCLPEYLGPMLGLNKPVGMNVLDYLYHWLQEQGFDYSVAGVNHFIWLTKANYQGNDMLPMIREYCRTHEQLPDDEKRSGSQAIGMYHNNGAAKFALCRQFGYLPLAGDRHLVEFHPALCNIRNGYGMKYGVIKTTVDSRRLSKINKLSHILRMTHEDDAISWHRSGEELTEIIRAIVTDSSTTAIVNMPNQGQIPNLPNEIVVETLADVSKLGVSPREAGPLPGSIASMVRLHVDIHELTVRAALEGNRDLFVQALSLDPLSASADFSELVQLADELLSANRQWLPRFYTNGKKVAQ
ncbi:MULTISPECIES: family 4 glycosyl hydrolase [unclassified Paenibacillus]|uniref:family 4 glycosyl hydrolase n=1 Tax=unclassified Paenibacillus TaxID=185978 RepID=UPI00363C8109